MSIELDIEVEGADEAAATLREIGDNLQANIGEALRQAAELIVSEAQANAPVDTGHLRDSIEVTEESDDSVTVVAGAEYAAYVEYGTSKMAAQPFFEPAIESVRSEIERMIRDALEGSLS